MGMLSLLFSILAGAFVYNDARKSGREFFTAMLWGVGSAMLPIVVVPLYLFIGRRSSMTTSKQPHDDAIDIEATVIEDNVTCPMCGGQVKEESSSCPHCSYTLKPKCQSCGRELNREWKICPYCQTQAPLK